MSSSQGMSLCAEVTSVIEEKLEVTTERVRPEASFVRDLGADSLSLIELTLALEERFEIDIDVGDVAQIRTVQDAFDYVAAKLRS